MKGNSAEYFTVPEGVGANLIDTGRDLIARYVPRVQKLLTKVSSATGDREQEAPAESVPDEHPGPVVESASPSMFGGMPEWARMGLLVAAGFLIANALGKRR